MVKLVSFFNNVLTLISAINQSTGIADANKIIETNVDGKLDNSFLSNTNIHKGISPPIDTNLFWFETNTNFLLYYNSGSWYTCNQFSSLSNAGAIVYIPSGYLFFLEIILPVYSPDSTSTLYARDGGTYLIVSTFTVLSTPSTVNTAITVPSGANFLDFDTPSYRGTSILFRYKKI